MQSRWTPTTKEIVYDERKLYNYGINRLSVRDYGRQELKQKMERFQKDSTMLDKVLDKLETQGYLSDTRRINALFNQFSGRESINKTKNRMIQKGLSKDMVNDFLQEKKAVQQDETPEQNTAVELIEKKFKSFDTDDKQKLKEKIIRHLASKGFKYDDIKKAMEKFFNMDDN